MTVRRVTTLALIAGSGIGVAACGNSANTAHSNPNPYQGTLRHEVRTLYPGATGIKFDDGYKSDTGNIVWTMPDGQRCAGQYEYSYNLLAMKPYCVDLGGEVIKSTRAEVQRLYPGMIDFHQDDGYDSDTTNAVWKIPGGQICTAEASYDYFLVENQPVCFSGFTPQQPQSGGRQVQ